MTDNAFAEWLSLHAGVAEPRRLVRRDSERLLVSKFDEGFASRLHDALGRVPEIFETSRVCERYRVLAGRSDAGRAAGWHAAIADLLRELGAERGLTSNDQAEIRAGIDSVAALLDSILWTSPAIGAAFVPSSGEVDAYREAIERMDADPGMFTRFYGVFEGVRVENHCPGAPFARKLLAQAWTICTRAAPPE
jgi:hypothetical protein